MADIVNLKSYRTKAVQKRGLAPWEKRFGETFKEHTCFPDLSEKTIYALAVPGEGSNTAFYELIMGILNIGKPAKFYYLEKDEQLRVVDIHLFLADQVRFEMMRRLQWLNSNPCDTYALLDMVQDFDRLRELCRSAPPQLSPLHPEFKIYNALTEGDKESFVRRLLPKALEAFKLRL
jgi:hypothetical protein